jgi:hypothetical protein
VNDQWIPGPPVKPPTWVVNPLPPANVWDQTEGCTAESGPAIVQGITITGVPATVSSLYWQVSLNDGGSPPNFEINHLDGAGNVLDAAMEISGADLSATFAGPVFLARDPVEPMEAVTLEFLEAHAAGVPEPPDNQTYGRAFGVWNLVVPASGGTFSGPTNLGSGGAVTSGALLFAGNAVCSLPDVSQLQIGGGSLGQVPATDGNGNLSWVTPVTGGPYLPIAGGTVTGNLTVNGVTTVQGPNSLVLNAPVNNARAILCSASNVMRWVLNLGDQTAEGLNNVGANFSLQAYSTTGTLLGTWLSIARADGSTVFNGSGVTIQGGLAVNGLLVLASPNNLAIYGGTPGQFLSTNGSGVLSWASAAGGGASITVSDTPPSAPSVGALWWDSVGGQLYVWYADANTSQWVPASNAASLPPPASTTVLGSVKVDGTSIKAAADGTISTVLIPMGDNRLINGDMRIDQRWNGASGTAVNVYTVDRWQYSANQIAKGTWQQRPGVAPGFPYYLGFNSTSAYTSVAGDNFNFLQPVEADMVSDFAWGTANAQPAALSFWAFSSLSGTFGGAIRNMAGTRSYPFTYLLVASTWTKIVIIIPADIGGTWVMSGNAAALLVCFDLGCGSTYRGPPGAWAAANYLGANGAVSIVAVNQATFFLTGVKLEIGSVATPYNRQSLAKSMADCQRYYQSFSRILVGGYATAGVNVFGAFMLPVVMRAQPTVVLGTPTYGNASAWAVNGVSTTDMSLQTPVTTTGTGTAAGPLTLSAEL